MNVTIKRRVIQDRYTPRKYDVINHGTTVGHLTYWPQERKRTYAGGYWTIDGQPHRLKFPTKEAAAAHLIEATPD